MSVLQSQLTEAQEHLIGALDDAAEHVVWEWDKPDPESYGTCGFAHIKNIDGRGSFVRRVKSLAETDHPMVIEDRRGGYAIEAGSLEMSLREAGRGGGYRLSFTNIASLVGGPAHQRLDVRREVCRLFLERLRSEWGYFSERTRVYGRMD